jgi:small subunit ribosomal protein S8
LDLLKEYKFIEQYQVREEDKKKFIDISLKKVTNAVDDIPTIKFFSKPSRAWYVGYKHITNVAGGKGI